TSARPTKSSGAPLPRPSASSQAAATGLRKRTLQQPKQSCLPLRSPYQAYIEEQKHDPPTDLARAEQLQVRCTDRVKGRRSLLRPSLRDRSGGPAALPRKVIRAEGKVDGDANEERQQSPSARCHFASCTPTRRAAQGLRCLGGSLRASGRCPALDARAGSWLSVHSRGESCVV